jgi:hypothetical protein
LNQKPGLKDFYDSDARFEPSEADFKDYQKYLSGLDASQRNLLENELHFYELNFENLGGLVMPIILKFTFSDQTDTVVRLPAEVWLKNELTASKVFWFNREVTSIETDPFLETADTDLSNNHWPARLVPTRFELFKERERIRENPMQRARPKPARE